MRGTSPGEDRADEYAALITSWWGDGYATIGR